MAADNPIAAVPATAKIAAAPVFTSPSLPPQHASPPQPTLVAAGALLPQLTPLPQPAPPLLALSPQPAPLQQKWAKTCSEATRASSRAAFSKKKEEDTTARQLLFTNLALNASSQPCYPVDLYTITAVRQTTGTLTSGSQ
jgi:hypothetical protein